MSIIDNHSAFNNWQVTKGLKISSSTTVENYLNIKKYTVCIKSDLSHSLKELIVKDINSQLCVRRIGVSNVNTMIDILNSVSNNKVRIFKKLREKDFFEAFRYLHKLTYG